MQLIFNINISNKNISNKEKAIIKQNIQKHPYLLNKTKHLSFFRSISSIIIHIILVYLLCRYMKKKKNLFTFEKEVVVGSSTSIQPFQTLCTLVKSTDYLQTVRDDETALPSAHILVLLFQFNSRLSASTLKLEVNLQNILQGKYMVRAIYRVIQNCLFLKSV